MRIFKYVYLNLKIEEVRQRWEQDYKITTFERLPWETNEPEKELIRILEQRKIKPSKALDIGCGAGTHSIFLAKSGFDVTAIDISQTAIEVAKERAKKSKVRITFVVGNAFDLKFPSRRFGFVFDRGCFHHVRPELREKYIEGIHRVLKENGKYLLICFSTKNPWQDENVFSLDRIEFYFGDKLKILEAKEVIHTQPDGEKVFLWSVLMEKVA